LAPSQADTAPTITFNTGTAGTFTETITLMPASSNGNGSASLPAQTLTVTGTVAVTPSISAPSAVVVGQGRTSPIRGVSITDVYAQNTGQTVTVTLGDTNGRLFANTNAAGGGGNITGNGTSQLTITGTLAQVNSDLGTLGDADIVLGSDSITVNASDASVGDAPAQTIAVTASVPPAITTPFVTVLVQGQATAISGISISEDDSANKTFTVTLADTDGLLSASTNASGGGGTIIGAGTTVMRISGSLAQVNADLTTLIDTDSSANPDTITIYANDGSISAAPQTVSVSTSPSSTIGWDTVKSANQPVTLDQTDWSNIFAQSTADLLSAESISTKLDRDAQSLARWLVFLDTTTNTTTTSFQVQQDVAFSSKKLSLKNLVKFEWLQASGGLLPRYIAGASDQLRNYDGSLLTRNNPGPFGDGWVFAYDIRPIPDASGNVWVESPKGLELFKRKANGSFVALSGDGSVLSLVGGTYQLVDPRGNVYRFDANLELGSITNPNGNTTTLNRDGAGHLQSVTSWTGQSTSFTYNGFGRIASVTDASGSQFTYSYDSTGTLLLSSTGPNGTTTYAYNGDAVPAADNALAEITNPDETHEYFQYDAQGRLSDQHGDNGAGLITYSYNNTGQVTVTDAVGDSTALSYDINGNVAQIQDALGNVTRTQYNATGRLTGRILPDGSTWKYSYNASGNLISYTDPLGDKVTAYISARHEPRHRVDRPARQQDRVQLRQRPQSHRHHLSGRERHKLSAQRKRSSQQLHECGRPNHKLQL
jgi:YD repeat-containing protein